MFQAAAIARAASGTETARTVGRERIGCQSPEQTRCALETLNQTARFHTDLQPPGEAQSGDGLVDTRLWSGDDRAARARRRSGSACVSVARQYGYAGATDRVAAGGGTGSARRRSR